MARVQEAAWRTTMAARVIFFTAGVLAALSLVTLFIPRATIQLSPISQLQSINMPVSASLNVTSVQLSGVLPARRMSVLATAVQTVAITTQGAVPSTGAEGIARFLNLTQAAVAIPAGTIVYTTDGPAVQFQTVNTTHIPAGPNRFVEVPIIASANGAAGNVAAGAIQAIQGSLALSASVTNPNPTTGGTDLTATAAADADRQRLHDEVVATLDQQAAQQLVAALGPQDVLLPNTVQGAPPLQEIYDPPAGQPGETLKLTMSVEYSAQYVSADDFLQLAQSVLDASMPAGFVSKAGTLQFSSGAPFVGDSAGDTHFSFQAGRTLFRQVSSSLVLNLVRGLPPAQAKRLLQSRLPLAFPPRIQLSPSWWPWLPLIPFRIGVE